MNFVKKLPVLVSPFVFVLLVGCSDDSSVVSEVQAKQPEVAQSATVKSDNALMTALDVYKSPTCGCCEEWITHAESHDFKSTIFHPENLTTIKEDLGIEPRYRSCHTAVSENGYAFEGHVPAKYVAQFLANPPQDAIGLSVPGMPAGSPGMEMANTFTPYPILLLKKDGTAEVYAKVEQQASQY